MMKNYMKKTMLVLVMGVLAMSSLAATSAVTPSTNDENRDNGWAHFNVVDTAADRVTVEFVSTRTFASCFEYRSDGEDPTYEQDNFNGDIDDGLWEFVCVNNETVERTLFADEHVEIRMVFGAERDERFDWTRVDVEQPPTKEDCKDGGWEDRGYRNQGQCVSEAARGK